VEATHPRRETAGLLLLIVLPLLLTFAVQAMGYGRYLRLAAVGMVAAALGGVVFLRPRAAAYFLAFYAFAALGTILPASIAQLTTLAVLAAALVGFQRGDHNGFRDAPFLWAMGFFFVFCFHSMLYAHHIDLSLVWMFSMVKVFTLVFVIVHFVRTAEQLRRLALFIFLGAVATVVGGFVAYRLGIDIDPTNEMFLPRFSGLHGDPNYGAAHMCAALPLGIFAVRYETRKWLRAVYVLFACLLILGVFLTLSRGGVFALATVLVGVVAREARSRRAYTAIAGLLAALPLLAPVEYWERLRTLSNLAEYAARDWALLTRVRALETAWELSKENPFTGIGVGNFIMRGSVGVWVRIVVHNAYMEVLVGAGVLGLLAFLAMLGAGLRQMVRGARMRLDWPEWMPSLCYYFAVSLVASLMAALFLSIMYRYLLWVPVAAGLVIGNLIRQSRPAAPAPRG
jgi:O-antigen ligase